MDQERRQFFRINEHISLDYQEISEEEMQQSPQPTQFEVTPYFTLLTQLQELDADSTFLLRKISQKDPTIGSFLEIINSKVEAIAKTIASSDMEFKNLIAQETNLSEGGLSFDSNSQLATDGFVAMKLIFQESCIGLLLYGKVLYSVSCEDGFNTGIEFCRMPESSRMIIARHIISSQSRQIQNQEDED
ncbi:MAG: PilZ domain-containing protein [Amphritea sp.]